jgi:hypothetical protein
LLDFERGFFVNTALLLLWLDFVIVIDDVEALAFRTSSVIGSLHDFKKSWCKFSLITDLGCAADAIEFSKHELEICVSLAMKAKACLNIFKV